MTGKHDHDCKNLLSNLSDYVDGELSVEICAELEQHLSGCENCRIVVNTLRKTIDIYHQTGAVESIPADVRSRLFKCLNLGDLEAEASRQGSARPGGICPHCKQGVMDYDGTLTLRCPQCGFAETGCST